MMDKTQLPEIHPAITYPFPLEKKVPAPDCVYVNSLDLRDDATLVARGFVYWIRDRKKKQGKCDGSSNTCPPT